MRRSLTVLAIAGLTAAPAATASARSTSAPVTCLEKAGLQHVKKRRAGLWSGEQRRTGEPVLVDGPYKTASKARASAKTLVGVQAAKAGGRYVVTAALTGHVDSKVRSVAKCLAARG